MKMIAGAASFALANRSRTRAAPTPTIASMNSEAAIEKNAACASPATARASSVLPVPGGPYSSTPWGIRPPSFRTRSGVLRKSTISVSSAFASSIPATSSNVTRIFSGSTRRACERPKLPNAAEPPPAPRAPRASSTNNPTSSSVGPKPSRQLGDNSEAPGIRVLRVDLYALGLQRRETSLPCQKDGTCVENSVVGVAFLSFGG